MTDQEAPSLYPVTLDPDKPILAIGLPTSIYQEMLHNTAELVRPILNCDSIETRKDPETDKDFSLFKRNLEPQSELNDHLSEAFKIIQMILGKIANLMSEQMIEDNTDDGEYWRVLIELDKKWQKELSRPKGAKTKPYGWRHENSSLQWNDNKGVLRIKTKTLADLITQTEKIIKTLIN